MIDRKKFDDLTEEEKGILGESIGLPDYDDDNELYAELNRCWSSSASLTPEEYIEIVSKLL